jgi:hypothetical protein
LVDKQSFSLDKISLRSLHLKCAHHEGLKHVQSGSWLIHGDHVAGFVDSKELEVLVLLKLTSRLTINEPLGILSVIELGLAGPLDSVGPCLTTSPVTYKVLVSRINENLESSLENSLNLGSQVVEPVSKKFSVYFLAALNPFTLGRNAKLSLNCCIVEELIGVAQVIAKGRLVTLFADVIDVESWCKWVTENCCHSKLAELKSIKEVSLSLGIGDHALAF